MTTRCPSEQFTVGTRIRGPGFEVHQVDYSPAYRRGPHAHDWIGITLILDGSFREVSCGREVDASALSVVVKPAGTVHADVVGPRGARTVAVKITDETVLLGGAGDLGSWRWLHAGPGVRPLLGLQRTLLDPEFGADVQEVVHELLGEVAEVSAPDRGDVPHWVRSAREALDDLAAEGMLVADLARQVGVHPVSLTRAFRRAYGVPVTTYRRRVRLRRAAEELTGSDRNLGIIAHAAGYADQPHMCREVKRATGCTPSDIRELART